jgi:hypothetical protein
MFVTKTKKLDDLVESDDDIELKNVKKNNKKIENIIDSDSDTNSSSSIESSSDSDSKVKDEFVKNDFVNKKKIDVLKKKIPKNSNEIFKELIKKQLPDVPSQWKLNINDMKRICKYIDTSIFDKKICCIWNGYITNMNNSNKGTYVNFYFRNKKVALHRLLYSNFVAPLDSSEYLKFNCDNKGICCNINHYEKYKYSKNNGPTKKEQKHKEPKKEIKEITIVGSDDTDKLTIDFD